MPDIRCHTLVVGAGPGGYVCAIRAAQLGLDTVIVEAVAEGGTCLNVGCIPSKAIIHAAHIFDQACANNSGSDLGIKHAKPRLQFKKTILWKDGIVTRLTGGVRGLLKKYGVRSVHGWATFLDGKNVEVTTEDGPIRILAEHIVIATGSAPVELPSVKFGGIVCSSTDLLACNTVPEKLVVVGAGYIGLELGTAFAKLGASVTLVEAEGKVLPRYDTQLTAPVHKRIAALGVDVRLGTKLVSVDAQTKTVSLQDADGLTQVEADKVAITVGRRPVTDGWGRDNLELRMNGAFISIDEQCQTSMRGLYAIGDVTGEPMLAHRAMAQGEMVAEILAGHPRKWDKRAIPSVCFTDPEVLTVGLLPDEAKAAHGDVLVSLFPLKANGRALTMERDDGFVRIIARKSDGLLLGMQAVGHAVSELSAGFGVALEMAATLEDLAGTIHAHPTLGEAIHEASLMGLGHALHT